MYKAHGNHASFFSKKLPNKLHVIAFLFQLINYHVLKNKMSGANDDKGGGFPSLFKKGSQLYGHVRVPFSEQRHSPLFAGRQ